MDENNDRPANGADKPKFEGNWKCSKCGGDITSLPFKPDPARMDTLVCLDCFKKKSPRRDNDGPRQKFSGNWRCSDCGGTITELPFEPRPEQDNNLKCFDCYKK